MNTKKILIVVESIDIEHSSAAKGRIALIKNLQKIGYSLEVFHYSRKEIQLEGIPCHSISEIKGFLYLLVRLQRVFTRITKVNLNNLVDSLFGFSFSFFNDAKSIKRAVRNVSFSPDLVITLSYASSFRAHKALLGIKKWHDKWISYVHDPFPMHSYPRPYDWVELGHQKKRSFFLKVCSSAKYIAYPSKLLAEWMRSYYLYDKQKEIIIPHQVIERIENVEKFPSFFQKDKFNILHAGSMMSARNPMILVAAFDRFVKKDPIARQDARLIFIGKKSIFDSAISNYKNNQICISKGYVSFNVVHKLQELSSVNIILEAAGYFSPFLPGKFPHCISSKKPILLLGPQISESKRLLGADYSYWSEIDDIDKIEELITSLFLKWKTKADAQMERNDLLHYLGTQNLKATIDSLC